MISRPGWRKCNAVCLACLLATISVAPRELRADGVSEYQVKMAFLFHFAQFVEWPPEAFKDASSPLTYCTIGDDPFHGALEDSLKGKTIASHPLQVQHLKDREQINSCQILFVAASEKKRVADDLAAAAGRSVLTVGETEHFAQNGGMIGFVLDDDKVRFEINVQSALKAKLKISSRLLLLAKSVIGSQG
jgi:uncharacterized protein DUF4154